MFPFFHAKELALKSNTESTCNLFLEQTYSLDVHHDTSLGLGGCGFAKGS